MNRALAISRTALTEDLLLTGAFAIALFVSPVTGRAATGLGAATAAALIAGLSVVYGRAIYRWLEVNPGSAAARGVVIITGFCGVSLVHLAATSWLNLSVLSALAIDVALGGVLLASMATAAETTTGPAARNGDTRGMWLDAAMIVASGVLVALWTRETIFAVPEARTTGIFRAWQDFLLHASEISYLRDYPSFGARSPYMTSFAQPLYHRASYAMSAVFSAITGASSLQTATAFWMPSGVLLCTLGIYAFGSALGGRRLAGVAAVAAVLLMPDASTYGFHNRFLSTHWLLQMAAGSGYAVGLTLAGLVAIVTAAPARHLRSLVMAGILMAAGAAFRVHVALLAGGMVVVLGCFSWRPRRLTTPLVVALIIAGAAGAAVWMESVALAPHFLTGARHPLAFFLSVHSQAAGVATPYTDWVAGHGTAWTFTVGYALMLIAGCGVLVPLWLAGWFSGTFTSMGWRAAAIPAALIVSHVAVILLIPTPAHGDVTDWGHRPFVLIYIVVAAMSGAMVARWLFAWSVRGFETELAGKIALWVLCAAGCVVPWVVGADLQQRWSPQSSTIPISGEAFDAADFIRRRSMPGQQVLAADEDPLAVFVALTERGAYLARADLYRSLGPPTADLANERAAAAAVARASSSFDELRRFGQTAGISWYIANTPDTRGWPAAITSSCAYCAPEIQVYDLR